MLAMEGRPVHVGTSQLPAGLTQTGTIVASVADLGLRRQVAVSVPLEGSVPLNEHEATAVQVVPFVARPHSNRQTPSTTVAPLVTNAGSGACQQVVGVQLPVEFIHFPSVPHVALSLPSPPLQAAAEQMLELPRPADTLLQRLCHSVVLKKIPSGNENRVRVGAVLHTATVMLQAALEGAPAAEDVPTGQGRQKEVVAFPPADHKPGLQAAQVSPAVPGAHLLSKQASLVRACPPKVV